jgi:hypothetical protein
MTAMRRLIFTLAVAIIVVVPFSCSTVAILLSVPARADTVLYPTLPGTAIRDYSRPGILVEHENGNVVYYNTLPGTSIKDYSRPGWVVENSGEAYPTLPGTSYRDYNRGGWR